MPASLTRRAFCGSLAAGAAAFLAAGPARALSEPEARQLIDRLVAEVNAVISSGRSEAAMLSQFEQIFRKYADTAYVAAYAMGVDGRRASAAQKRAFTDAFITYVARKYGRRFREFIGSEITVTGVRQSNNYYEVSCTAALRGQAPFRITFNVSDRSGRDEFFNLYIEGVNMLLTERTEVGALLDANGGDIDAMIADLRRAA